MITKSKIILTCLSVAALFSCTPSESTNESPATKNETSVTLDSSIIETIGIETVKPTMRRMSEKLQVNGQLDVPPQNLVTISAPMGGFVKSTTLLQGMYVKKGQRLLVMEDPEYIQLQQDYIESASQLEFASAEYTRQQELAAENVNATKTLQQAKSQFESLRARVSGLKAKLSIINISPESLADGNIQPTISLYSPINGYVSLINVNLGQHVDPTDVIVKIIDNSHLHAELFVFEQDVPKLYQGQKVQFTLLSDPTVHLADVYLIGKEVVEDRTVRVHCHFDDNTKGLIAGMYIRATIETTTQETEALPESAILNFEGTNYVFVTPNRKTFEITPVTIGTTVDGYTQVTFTTPLGNNSVVSKGAYQLLGMLKNTEEE